MGNGPSRSQNPQAEFEKSAPDPARPDALSYDDAKGPLKDDGAKVPPRERKDSEMSFVPDMPCRFKVEKDPGMPCVSEDNDDGPKSLRISEDDDNSPKSSHPSEDNNSNSKSSPVSEDNDNSPKSSHASEDNDDNSKSPPVSEDNDHSSKSSRVSDDNDGSPKSSQMRFHLKAKEMIRDYILNELPINLLRLPELVICNRWSVWGHVQSIMDRLESLCDVPIRLRDSEPEPDHSDIVAFATDNIKWAIFSHRWTQSEPNYQDVTENKLSDKPGHQKLRNFCKIAHEKHGAEFAWSDTCCINKQDNSETATSIRSMYRWYANAPLCIVHLSETIGLSDLEKDVWLTRGWTLQELLAPKKLKFYNKDWSPLTNHGNDKDSSEIAAQIQRQTTITLDDLQNFVPADRLNDEYEISKRMRWAARRETTVGEDKAYSLMGIFSVSLYIDYGEGQERAVWRLMKEILEFSNSPEVLNWAGHPSHETHLKSAAFPSRITCFIGSNDTGTVRRHDEELAMTPRGLKVHLLVLCAELVAQDGGSPTFQGFGCEAVSPQILDSRHRGDHLRSGGRQYAFGVWNFHNVQGKCELTSTDPLEAILLTRQIDPLTKRPKTPWAKVCTKDFLRLKGVKNQEWEIFKEQVLV